MGGDRQENSQTVFGGWDKSRKRGGIVRVINVRGSGGMGDAVVGSGGKGGAGRGGSYGGGVLYDTYNSFECCKQRMFYAVEIRIIVINYNSFTYYLNC